LPNTLSPKSPIDKLRGKRGTLDKLMDIVENQGIELIQEHINDPGYYQDKTGRKITRLTEFTNTTFSIRKGNQHYSLEEYLARRDFENARLNPETDVYKERNGRTYTLAQLIGKYTVEFNEHRAAGRFGHAIIELATQKDRNKKTVIVQKIAEIISPKVDKEGNLIQRAINKKKYK
jgi:hypothetical protein